MCARAWAFSGDNMGVCLSTEKGVRNVSTGDELMLTVAFVDAAPITVVVKQSDTLGVVREKVRDSIGRPVDGNAMTMRGGGGGGDAVRIGDTTTVKKAKLEPRQMIWFADSREEARVKAVVLRGSRLKQNVARSSRGVKKGIAIERRSSAVAR